MPPKSGDIWTMEQTFCKAWQENGHSKNRRVELGGSMAGVRRVVVHEDDIGICHGANVAFSAPGDIDVIAPHERGIRPDEFALFRSDRFRGRLVEHGLEPIGMRPFRDAMRTARAP
jgi:hypothetical protein